MAKVANISDKANRRILLIVQLAAIGVLAGRAWQHLWWDAPFRSLLWDEGWMRPIVENWFRIPWQSYITSEQTDAFIDGLVGGFGWFYLLCALVAAFARQLPRPFWYLLPASSAALLFLALLYCKERFFSIGQFFEYTLQFLAPYFLFVMLRQRGIRVRLVWCMRLAIALTFTCHGLYAVGYYPRPGSFVDMTLSILPISEEGAHLFLWWAGILDFVMSGFIILAPAKWIKSFLIYAVLWGFATTVARIWAHFYWEFATESLLQWTFEAVYRLPHFLIPLAVLYYVAALDKDPS